MRRSCTWRSVVFRCRGLWYQMPLGSKQGSVKGDGRVCTVHIGSTVFPLLLSSYQGISGKRCSYFTKSFGYFNVPFLLLCSQTIDLYNIKIISITATIFTILLRNKKKNPTFRNPWTTFFLVALFRSSKELHMNETTWKNKGNPAPSH